MDACRGIGTQVFTVPEDFPQADLSEYPGVQRRHEAHALLDVKRFVNRQPGTLWGISIITSRIDGAHNRDESQQGYQRRRAPDAKRYPREANVHRKAVERNKHGVCYGIVHDTEQAIPWKTQPGLSAFSSNSSELLLSPNKCANPFSKQCCVERFAKRFVEQRAVETARVVFIAEQTN